MSHYITLPIDANGVIDPDEQIEVIIQRSMSAAFGTTDIFIYSHGWWTDVNSALKEYNVATTDFIYLIRQLGVHVQSPAMYPFLIGVHWPSAVEDAPEAFAKLLDPLTFYKMQKRADDIGEEGVYAVLRLIMKYSLAGSNVRITMFGHSFGCKVVCAALQKLVTNNIPIPGNVSFALVLLEAAFSTTRLDPGEFYGDVVPLLGSRLRVLISRSDLDFALRNAYPLAQIMDIFSKDQEARTALGFTGPTPATLRSFQNLLQLDVKWGDRFLGRAGIARPPDLLVANLTPLHSDPQNTYNGGLAGHHSDIFRDEIYSLMGWFLFG
jgi:hypothetical protein